MRQVAASLAYLFAYGPSPQGLVVSRYLRLELATAALALIFACCYSEGQTPAGAGALLARVPSTSERSA